MKMTAAACALFLVTSPTIAAQSAPEGPRPGAWGAEASVDVGGPAAGGSVLRFLSNRSAVLFGLSAMVSERDVFFQGGDGTVFLEDRRTVNVGARLGYRAFRSLGSRVRPIVGGGIVGSVTQVTNFQHLWSAGAYGELGVTRFFGANFSLGATSELRAQRTEYRAGDRRPMEIRVEFDAVRIAAMVVF